MGIKSALYKVLDYPWPERGTRHALHTTRTLPVHQLRKPSVLSSDIHGGSTSILGGLGKNTQARVGPSKPKSDDFRQHVVVYSAYPVSGAQLGAFVYGEDFATDQNNLDILAGEDTTVSDAGVTSHAMLRTEALGKVTSTGTATTTIGGDVPTTTSGTDTLGNVVNTTATTTANKVDKACAELYGSLNKTSAPIARFETRGIRLGMVDTSCLPRQECGTEGRSDTAHCSEVAGNAQAQGGGSTSNGLDIGDNGDAGNDHELVRDRDSPAQHGSAPMVNRCRRIHGNSSSSAYAGARAMDALAVSLNGWFLTLHATCCLSRALNVHDATLAAAYCPPLTHLHSDHTHVLGSGIATDTHPAVGGDAGDTLDALPRRISIPIPAARLKQYRSRHADTARGEGLAAAQAQPIQSAQLHTRVHTVQTTGVHTHIQMGGDGAKGHAHTGDMENTVRDMTVNMVSITTAETSPVVAMAINADAHGTVSSLPVQIGRSESEPTEAACDSNTILIKTESIPANGQMLAELTVNPILTATDSTGGGPLYAEATIDPNTAEAELDNIPIDRAIPTEPALRLKVGKMVGSPIEVMIPTERALDSTAGNTDSTLIDEVVPAQHVSGSTAATTETTLIDGQIPTELEQGLESVAADTSSTRVGETLPTEKLLDSTTAKAASVSFDRTIPTEQVQALEPVANDANSTSAEEIIPTEEVLNSMAAKTVSISMDGKVVTEGAKNSTATDANTSVRRIALGVMTEPWYTGPSIARTHNAGTGDSLPNIHAHEKMALVNITNSMTHSGSSTDKQAEHTDDEAVVSTAYTPTYTHKHTHDNAMDGIAKTDSMGEPSGAMDRQQVHQQRFDYVQSLRQMLHLANTKAQRDSEKGPLLAAETKAASKDKEKRSSSARLKDTADNDEGLAILELTLGKLRDDYAVKKSVSHAVKSAFNTYTTYLAKSLAPKQIKARVKSVVKRRLIQTHDSMNTKVSEMFKTTGVDAEVNGIAFRSQQIRVCQVQVAIRFQLSFMEQPKKDDPKSKRIRETLKYIQTISLLTGGGEPFNDYILNDLTKTHAETFPLTTAYLNSELDLEDMETTANEIRSGLPRNATAGTSTNNLVHTAVSHVSSGTEDLFSGRDNLFIARENTLPHASTDATTGGVGESGTRLVSNCSFGIGNSNADNFDIGNPNQADINSKMAMRRTLTNNSSRRTVVMNHRNSLRSTDSQSNLALYQPNTSERRAKRLSQRPAVVSRHSNNQNQSLLSIGQSFLSNTRWEQGTPCDGGESSATDDLQLHS
ncbi:hypothetical protein SARC_11780 [Sphaeroforma arctica JP610]|uniref:Uncharacterized protein n=1 Tax=Sphaeroforma arctica JP610 TaxID=667725 RepID=A0A0L0FG24_9EUKA|nr:hypothetical protein SARC_11780 [Sphaeroforma arctica JP610]KNC75700.1 hypothetical protein SARC_11780 [Sphaeroforma arctica JP610]|eukprot:XP_014149602.1 hypothetical protein SARC_11780 [Sphaeroforma arctica JP610]